jgi:hypothetical protein
MPQSAVQFPLASIFPTLTAGRGLAFGVWRLAVGCGDAGDGICENISG